MKNKESKLGSEQVWQLNRILFFCFLFFLNKTFQWFSVAFMIRIPLPNPDCKVIHNLAAVIPNPFTNTLQPNLYSGLGELLPPTCLALFLPLDLVRVPIPGILLLLVSRMTSICLSLAVPSFRQWLQNFYMGRLNVAFWRKCWAFVLQLNLRKKINCYFDCKVYLV